MDETLRENLFKGLTVNTEYGKDRLLRSPAITTALVPYIGYHEAALVASEMKKNGTTIMEANDALKLMDPSKLKEILEPGRLLQLGYQLGDLG
jgi:aspartate ammonia-lyase